MQVLHHGGYYVPSSCKARSRLAILISYRDRVEHLMLFLNHIHPILIRQQIIYGIYVIQQAGSDLQTLNNISDIKNHIGRRNEVQQSPITQCGVCGGPQRLSSLGLLHIPRCGPLAGRSILKHRELYKGCENSGSRLLSSLSANEVSLLFCDQCGMS